MIFKKIQPKVNLFHENKLIFASKLPGDLEISGQVTLSDTDKGIIIPSVSGNPSSPSDGEVWLDTNQNRFEGKTSLGIVTLSGGGGGGGSLDDAYDSGATINVDNGEVTLTDTQTDATGGLLITKSGVITGANSADIFKINSSGAHDTSGRVSLLNLTMGTETATTPEGMRIIMNADSDDGIKLTKGSITLDDGDLTLSASGRSTTCGVNIITANTSGDGININLDTLTSGDGIVIDGDASGSVNYLAIQENSSNVFTVSNLVTSELKMIIDVDDSEAFLIRENGDATDVFIVDTIQNAGNTTFTMNTKVTSGIGTLMDFDTVTTGTGLHLTADGLTTGTGILISVTEGTLSGGYYLRCYDETAGANVLTLAENGALTIAGNAEGTDALIITAGDITLSDGDITLDGGEVSLTTDGANDLLTLNSTSGGTTGVVIKANHNSETPADDDVIFRLNCYSDDDGGNSTQMAKLDVTARDVTDSSEDAEVSLHTFVAGSLTEVYSANDAAGGTFDLYLPTSIEMSSAGTNLSLYSSDAGTVGPILKLEHDSASPADNDVIGKIHFYADDDGGNSTEFVKIEAIMTDASNGSEDGDLKFSVNVAGSLTQKMLLDSDLNGIEIGNGAATGVLQSNGNYNLTLQTGNSTTGTITIIDGANGDIDITPNGSGTVTMPNDNGVKIGAGDDFTISLSTDNVTLANATQDKDIIFNINVGGTPTEWGRLDGSAGTLLIDTTNKIEFRDTDLYINSSTDGQLDIVADTTVAVSGASTFDSTVTVTTGVQSATVSHTATSDGTGTGLIADGTTFVSMDGVNTDANDIITLPTPTPGNVVWVYDANGAGFELRSDTPSSVAINGGSGASAESAVTAGHLVRCVCTTSTTWVCSTFAADGTEAKLEAAA